MQAITPFLWFNNEAERAVRFYTSIFPKSKILATSYYTEGSLGKPGSVMTIKFRILDQEFIALNGGPVFKFNESVSFVVNCHNQKEVDNYWRKLSAGGKKVQCGWLKDKFGVSWQVVPTALTELIASDDEEKNERVMNAMLKMVKLDIKTLQRAAAGK